MSQYVETNTRTFTNGTAAIARYLRVKLATGVLAVAGIGDSEIGTTIERIAGSDPGAVHLRTANGTVPMTASAAITAGATVYTAASGKIGVITTGATAIGIAIDAAAADGDIVEVLRINA